MASSEERHCYYCGAAHLKKIHFFSYWGKCKECGTYLCPEHSGLQNSKITQYMCMVYVLITMFFYFGVFLIIAPMKDLTLSLLFSYSWAALIMFIPFFLLLYGIRSAALRLMQQPDAVHNCPNCNGPISIIYHDIFLYFWIFFIPLLYLATIANEIGIFFYLNFEDYTVSLGYVFNLVILVVLIILFFKWIGNRLLSGYKMHTRAWMGEIFSVFLILTLNIIFFVILPTDDFTFSFHLMYYISSVVTWYFPAFIIGSLIYKLTQKYFMNVNRSYFIHVLIAISVIVLPFFLWGLIDYSTHIYYPSDPSSLLPYYSTIFNEIIPILIISIVIGLAIISVFRTSFINNSDSKSNLLKRILIILGVSLFSVLLLSDVIFYFINGTFLLDLLPSSFIVLSLSILLICCLIMLIYEIFTHWSSSESYWGKLLEGRLGSLLYPIILAFIIIAITLGFPMIISISSSTTILLIHPLTTEIITLKVIFTVGLCCGLLIGLLKKK